MPISTQETLVSTQPPSQTGAKAEPPSQHRCDQPAAHAANACQPDHQSDGVITLMQVVLEMKDEEIHHARHDERQPDQQQHDGAQRRLARQKADAFQKLGEGAVRAGLPTFNRAHSAGVAQANPGERERRDAERERIHRNRGGRANARGEQARQRWTDDEGKRITGVDTSIGVGELVAVDEVRQRRHVSYREGHSQHGAEADDDIDQPELRAAEQPDQRNRAVEDEP